MREGGRMRVARRRRRDGVPIFCSPPRSCCSSHPAAGEFPGQVPPPPLQTPPDLPREFPSQWGSSPSTAQCLIWGAQSFIPAPPPPPALQLCSSPARNFTWGKKTSPANRTHDSTFLLALVSPSLARGSPWPPQPYPLAWKSGSSASSILSPLGFSSFILGVGWGAGSLMSGLGGWQRVGLGRMGEATRAGASWCCCFLLLENASWQGRI